MGQPCGSCGARRVTGQRCIQVRPSRLRLAPALIPHALALPLRHAVRKAIPGQNARHPCPAAGRSRSSVVPGRGQLRHSVGTAFAAPHISRQTRARQSCSRSGLPQWQTRGIRSAVGLRQILGLLVTPVGTRQTGWPARVYAPCRKSSCPPGRSAAGIRPAPRRTDDAARPASTRPVRKTPCSPTPSLPGIQSGRRRTDRVAPQRSTARARKPWRRAVVTALFRDSLHSR